MKIVEAVGNGIDKLLSNNLFLVEAEIFTGTHESVMRPMTIFGSTPSLLSSSDAENDLIPANVQSMLRGIDRFMRMHPTLGNLTPSGMVNGGWTAFLHNVTLQYFNEKKMI